MQVLPQIRDSLVSKLAADYRIDFPENYDELGIKKALNHLRVFTQPLHISPENVVEFNVTIASE